MTDTTPADEDFGKLYPEEFAAGHAAFQAGASRRSNPVKGDREKRFAWYWGYSEAERESFPDDDEELPTVTVADLIERLTPRRAGYRARSPHSTGGRGRPSRAQT